MRLFCLAVMITALPSAKLLADEAVGHLQADLQMLKNVGDEGRGNPPATQCWQRVSTASVDALPEILAALDDANPLAANWIRLAVDAVASKEDSLPLESLTAFLAETKHNPRARRLAWELIHSRDSHLAEELLDGMLDDPSLELRYDAVAQLIDAVTQEKRGDAATATTSLKKALRAARNVEQIKSITASLKKLGGSIDLQEQFGFITHWQIIGPFDNTDEAGFNTVFPPEQDFNLASRHSGKDGDVAWRQFLSADPYGVMDLNKAFPGPGDGLKEVTAFATTTFVAETSRPAELRLGCKNAWKVWHNGKLLFGRDEYHRGMRIDQYTMPVALTAGDNTLLVKICQDGQTKDWTKQWQFQLRVCDATGGAILSENRPPTPSLEQAAATQGKEAPL